MDTVKKLVKDIVGRILNEEREIFGTLYHGTDMKSAIDIKTNGVSNDKSCAGYFGKGFYTTPDFGLAKSNYADFVDDDQAGVVLEFKLSPSANILDLRDGHDWEIWKRYDKNIVFTNDFYKRATRDGIDGLWIIVLKGL
jgi:hypothetical protein